MEQVEITVKEQDARLGVATKQFDVEIAAKGERVQHLEELAARQQEFKRELEEILVGLGEKNRVLR